MNWFDYVPAEERGTFCRREAEYTKYELDNYEKTLSEVWRARVHAKRYEFLALWLWEKGHKT